jgi:hypothetical protein
MKTRGCLIVVAILIGVCFFGAAHLFKGYSLKQAITFFLSPSPNAARSVTPIARSLKAYFRDHARYPSSLNDAGINAPDTFFGPWRYSVSDDGQTCSLSIGEYGRYLFEVSWSPESGWYIDA